MFIPPQVQQVMDEYVASVHKAAPGLLAGVYLHGSLALQAFDPGWSDVDIVAITSRRCAPSDIDVLQTVHHTLALRFPHTTLEASYLEWGDLGGSEATIPPHPHVHDGVFHASGYHDINDVTWWVLKHRGIALVGPSLDQLDIPVDWDNLVANMRHNLQTYWASFTTNPRRIAWLLNDYGIQWTVLGVLRQFYSFREHAITSKTGAGHYALDHTPVQWHQLIREAINIRENKPTSSYRFPIVRAAHAYAFLQLIISACDTNSI